MFYRLLSVLEITLPVFGLIGLGKLLQLKRALPESSRHTINFLVANFSLPSLIFLAVSRASFERLTNAAIIAGALVPTFLGLALFFGLARLLKIKGEDRAPFTYSPFWANVGYMGLPLAYNAFGETGTLNAAIVNAFAMPTFVVLGVLLLSLHGQNQQQHSLARKLRAAFVNPIFISAVAGIAVSLAADRFGMRQLANGNAVLSSTLNILTRFMQLLGAMGLPLALLAVGATLKFKLSASKLRILALGSFGKLILTPCLSYAVIRLFFPQTAAIDLGACVLVMATPCAVASYVISSKAEVAEELASELVVWSTIASVVTIPLWTYVLI